MEKGEQVERLARLLHESGRGAVAFGKVYRNDIPVKPFAEWDELHDDAKEGRRMMARHLLGTALDELLECLELPPLAVTLAVPKGMDPNDAAKLSERYPILKFFAFHHLPQKLADISEPFCAIAIITAAQKPTGNPETAAGLRKLLEAKDCFVRAAL